MLIDAYAEIWFDELALRAKELPPSRRLYLLLDGAFVPGLHRKLEAHRKAILFESLPSCSEETKDFSPFLTQFDHSDKLQASLIRRCSCWPMVSLIETQESLQELSARLAAWCVVEVDDERFNFRFADTRRLPAIFATLDETQREQFAGPAVRWSYVARDGRWQELQLGGLAAEATVAPVLSARQFSRLVDDSRADEILTLLDDRGRAVYLRPSRSHLLVSIALHAAAEAALNNDDLLDWCEWFWEQDQIQDALQAKSSSIEWQRASVKE